MTKTETKPPQPCTLPKQIKNSWRNRFSVTTYTHALRFKTFQVGNFSSERNRETRTETKAESKTKK